MAMTVDEVKRRKIKLEKDIRSLVIEFEKDTDTFCSYISFDRKVSKNAKKNAAVREVAVPEPERDGPVANVDVDLRFDL